LPEREGFRYAIRIEANAVLIVNEKMVARRAFGGTLMRVLS
jgi:hypothetical protein